MLPPKLGLLSYVADAFIEGQADEILLLPTSISFDQLHEIGEYAAYARGAEKKPEGLGWFVRFTRDQGARHFGKVYVRYGEPVSMRHYIGSFQADVPEAGRDDPELRLALHKMAFEVAWRIQRATPVSGTALITTMLLASHGRAWTLPQLRRTIDTAVTYLKDRDVPLTLTAEALTSDAGVLAALDALSSSGGPVTRFDGGEATVWAIDSDQQLAAAFYRNSIIHFFLDRSICEIALLAARAAGGDREARFWHQALELRDLLKFDFYFQERDEYRAALAAEMDREDPDWRSVFGQDPGKIDDLLRRMRPMTSPLMLRPFLEAYQIVADVLAKHRELDDESELVTLALGLGRQYRLKARSVRTNRSRSCSSAPRSNSHATGGCSTAAPTLPRGGRNSPARCTASSGTSATSTACTASRSRGWPRTSTPFREISRRRPRCRSRRRCRFRPAGATRRCGSSMSRRRC
jgi:glycerol-3-phosphate O-acyltransferase